jgi:hypothetical protein
MYQYKSLGSAVLTALNVKPLTGNSAMREKLESVLAECVMEDTGNYVLSDNFLHWYHTIMITFAPLTDTLKSKRDYKWLCDLYNIDISINNI